MKLQDTGPVMMTLNRNYSLASTLGHVLTFKKDEPLSIPPIMVQACAEIGAVRVDGKDAFKTEEVIKDAQPIDPGIRMAQIRSAVDLVCERNARDDFTAGNSPKVGAVSVVLGYKVDRNEVAKAWQQRCEDLVANAA